VRSGIVYLVGAGPGEPGLLTLRAAELLARAEVVIADHLVPDEILARVAPTAEVIARPARRAELDQGEVNRLLVERARAGRRVVRLKSGDPGLFGCAGDELEALAAAGIPCEIVPGVTAASAAAASAHASLTRRGAAPVLALVSGHDPDAVDWARVAGASPVVALYMGAARAGEAAARLVAAGRDPGEPVTVVARAGWPDEARHQTTLGALAAREGATEIPTPAIALVGVAEGATAGARPPLAGRRLLLLATKALGREERAALDEALAPSGAQLVEAAPLAIVPRQAELKQILAQIALPARAIAFASAHAVDALLGALAATGRDARALGGVRLAAVGQATARRLAERSLAADLVGDAGGAALAADILSARWEGPILVLGAADGRPELADALAAGGVEVVRAAAYVTVADDAALAAVMRSHRARPFAAIAFTSPRGAEALLDVLGGPERLSVGATRPLVGAIGETTRAALVARGVSVDVVPPSPSAAALVRALVDRLASGPGAAASDVGAPRDFE
jgi:uroporphyrinogen III methyltransferase/synthase